MSLSSDSPRWGAGLRVRMCWLVLCVLSLVLPARAEIGGELIMGDSPDWSAFQDRVIDAVQVETLGALWPERLTVRSVRAGERFSPELARRALRELSETGRYADVRAELLEEGARLILLIEVRPRRLVAQVRLEGSVLGEGEALRALELNPEDEVTEGVLTAAAARVRQAHERAGFTKAQVEVKPQDTDDPKRVLLRVNVTPGPMQRIADLRIWVSPSPHHPALSQVLSSLQVRVGDRHDEGRIALALEDLSQSLMSAGFYESRVESSSPLPGVVDLRIESGPLFRVRIEGNVTFGEDELLRELDLLRLSEPKPDLLEPLLRKFYVAQGFLDARIRFLRFDSKNGLESELYGWVREGERFQVESRIFPCLVGARSASALEEEIDGVLQEQFPTLSLVEPPSSRSLDAALVGRTDSRAPVPLPGQPWSSYSDTAYQAVRTHLEKLYRSEGYFDAEVGPVTLVRRTCDPRSPPNECRATGPLPLPLVDCSAPWEEDTRNLVRQTCVPDPERGVRCESSGVIVMPVRPGRQAVLYDVRIEGNRHFTERQLLDASGLELGEPVGREGIEVAARAIADLYAEEAYAFAEVDSEIELSPDHSRVRLWISVTEREPVRVSRIDIRGADKTREGLIRSRITLAVNSGYKKSVVEKSQRQIESLGVFTSVSVGLEDPGVPARDKVVVVTLSERPAQYLDIKGGFSTGEGFRIGFEYGHRNLGGEAIQLTLRSQLGIRPPLLIFEDDVRAKYETLDLGQLLERRNSVTVAFPEMGLGPLFRFEVEGLDAHTNQRDFGQTRDAGIVRLLFRPDRPYLFQVGATVELNNAQIFGAESLEEYVQENPNIARTIRVPQGQSVAVTQHVQATWDRRDRALSAQRGTFVNVGVEHVTARPVDERDGNCDESSTSVFDSACSEFLRYSGRVAGYVPLSKSGLTFAVSVRSGVIQHLTEDSRTYPDRLFFMGGVDSLRSHPQDSLVPEDVAQQILNPNSELTIDQVALRGGDFFFNPRAELRIPLVGSLQTAIFLDAGNLWRDRYQADLRDLRYAIGSGIRIETPVGPLVFDYGFNVDRVLDELFPERTGKRDWESLGAFHFSIGLF